jgi:serine/threonine protein kinase
LIGRQLQERYEIVRVIGAGGMGTVYEAREIATGQRVAIKWMHAHPFAPDDPDLLRFTQEARIAGSLDSPHVTRLLELARDPESDVPFQVMELLEGEDARALLDRVGPLRPDVALRIAAQACTGLAAAHVAGVVHRDIKPDNVFLSRGAGEVTVKILDFGAAKIRRSSEYTDGSAGLTAPVVSMTQSGQVVGTPLFMAPEQIEGAKHVDARSDVYAMGVTLYALLAGAPPHSKIKSFVQLLHTLVNAPPPPLADVAPWVPPEVVAVVDKAMTKETAGRYRSAAEMLEALRPLLRDGMGLRLEDLVAMDPAAQAAAERRDEGASNERPTSAEVVTLPASVPRVEAATRRPLWLVACLLVLGGVIAAAVFLDR